MIEEVTRKCVRIVRHTDLKRHGLTRSDMCVNCKAGKEQHHLVLISFITIAQSFVKIYLFCLLLLLFL